MQQLLPQLCQHSACLISRFVFQLVLSVAANRLLLGCECCYLTDVVKPRLEVLTAGLPGADIAAMVQEDPRLLFEELESSEFNAFQFAMMQPAALTMRRLQLWLLRRVFAS
jgi:hypothetical protein